MPDLEMNIARWGDTLLLSPVAEDDQAMLRSHQATATMVEGVLVMEIVTGAEDDRRFPNYLGGDHASGEYRYPGYHLNVSGRLRELPMFGLHKVSFTMLDEAMLIWPVPAAHTLPWPWASGRDKLRTAEVLLRERARSALAAGVGMREFVAGVPDWVKGAVPTETWREVVIDGHR